MILCVFMHASGVAMARNLQLAGMWLVDKLIWCSCFGHLNGATGGNIETDRHVVVDCTKFLLLGIRMVALVDF